MYGSYKKQNKSIASRGEEVGKKNTTSPKPLKKE